ncbi:T9SS type B sorting domain-containing protein [Labilibacter marinus]|uniref:T9SS type B sorting domain-containing protein n=1 Tax=Labilibacter marinus TaxID=1477105 RepID=UPI0008373825|nr:T9SS type B sorting domain-containing protein [Labilibacter marinus]
MKYLLIVFSFLCTITYAQKGNSFWFVAPDAIHAHGDEPLYFRITTFDEAANTDVTISMPANSGFSPISRSIGRNKLVTIEVPRSQVENRPVNSVNNKGILIESSSDITVYYEIADDGNPDKFTLKGDNGLGQEFYVPSQNAYANYSSYNGDANEKVDIVATVNNTVVTIVPTVNVTGHSAGVPYDITLNRGETYCVEYRNISASASMAGTYITSNNQIAVTISDDSINETSHPHDIIGDQLIPTSIIGHEYIGVKTNSDTNSAQKVFVLATEDDTYVFINNDNSLVRHLNRGELTSFDIIDNAIYISATKPVYAYQVSGLANVRAPNYANELGSALLPTIECTGSSKVAFTRVFMRSFWVQILSQGRNLNDFTMFDSDNNEVDYIDHINWELVTGTDNGDPDDTWYSAIVDMNISTGTPYTIENSNGLFHLSVLDENDPTTSVGSVSYGYFSSYGRMQIEGPTNECKGRHIELTTSVEMDNYRWFSESTGNTVLSSARTLDVTRTDKYWVTADVLHGGCTITDSVDVVFNLPEVNLGNDTTVCPGETLVFDLPTGYPSYNWSNSDNDNSTSISVGSGFSQELSVSVTDDFGCVGDDTIQINAYSVPSITLNKTSVCRGERIINTSSFDKYQWEFNGTILNTDETRNYLIPDQSGVYTLTAWTINGCVQTQNINVVVNELPIFPMTDQWACDGTTARINGPVGVGYSYLWSTGSTSPHIDLTSPTSYSLEVTDANGCKASGNASVAWRTPEPIDLGSDKEICKGNTIDINVSSAHTGFVWKYKSSATSSEVNLANPTPANRYQKTNAVPSDAGIYIVEATDIYGCEVSDEINVFVHDVDDPALSLSKAYLCVGEEIEVEAPAGYDSYVWYKDGVIEPTFTNRTIKVNDAGTYRVETTAKICNNAAEVIIGLHQPPTVSVSNDFAVCDGENAEIRVTNFTPGEASATFQYLTWNSNPRHETSLTSIFETKSAGNYFVTVYDNHGCSATDDVDVSVNALPTFTLADEWFCPGGSATINGPAGYTYNWSDGSTTQSITLSSITDYSLEITDGNGCTATSSATLREYIPEPIDLGDDTEECAGIDLTLGVSSTHSNYRWSFDDGTGAVALPTTNAQHTIVSSTVANSGDYILETDDRNGCLVTDDINVTFVASNPLTLNVNKELCVGDNIIIEASSGYVSYEWFYGTSTAPISTSNSISTSTAGTYRVEATSGGCKKETNIHVASHALPSVTLISGFDICEGDTAEISLTNFTQADAPFSYLTWGSDPTRRSSTDVLKVTPTVNSNYSVTVYDDYGCSATDDVDIAVNSLPSFTLSDITACDNSSERINGPSVAGYSYNWSTGSTDPHIDLSYPTKFSLEVTDNNGCKAEAGAELFWYTPSTISLGNDKSDCAENRVDLNSSSAFTNYVWSFKETSTSPINTLASTTNTYSIVNANINNSGIYTVEALDANGCPVSDDINIVINDVDDPTLSLSKANLCVGEEIEIRGTGRGYYTYDWYRNGTRLPNADNYIKVTDPGTYRLETSYETCSKSTQLVVNAYAPPSVKITTDTTICDGATLNIKIDTFTKGAADFQYLTWNGSSDSKTSLTSTNPVNSAGNYYVTVFDDNGCSATDDVNVNIYAPTIIAAIPPVDACENIGVTMTNPVAGALSYEWFKVEATTDVAGPVGSNWFVNQSGTYRVNAIDANGCPCEAEGEVNILPVPTLELGPNVGMCSGTTAVLSAPRDYAEYIWNANPLLNTKSINVNTTGTYTLLVRNAEGCEVQDQVDVVLNPSPVINLPNQEGCPGTAFTLVAPAGLSNYKWSTGETSTSIQAGGGKYWLSAKNSHGCIGTDTVEVNWYPVPNVNLGVDTLICPVNNLEIDAGAGFDAYLWHTGAITRSIQAELQDTINLVRVRNSYGCFGFDTKTIRQLYEPDVVICSDTSVCQQDTFLIDPGPGYISYLWNDNTTDQSKEISEPGEYWVEVSDGCYIFRDTANVVYQELPLITQLDTSIYARVAVLVEGGTAPYNYMIDDYSQGSDNVFTNLKAGEHFIEIEDFNGCKAEATVWLSDEFEIVVPPFFTPNSDGINDRWEIEGIDKYPDSTIKIYDRFGKLLIKYMASDPGWDGNYWGNPVPTDDYWYVIEITSRGKNLKGHITLKR